MRATGTTPSAPAGFVPTASAISRALKRAESGVTLDATEAETLLHCRHDDLERLLTVASRVRDAGLEKAGRPGVITYSRKVFIPLTIFWIAVTALLVFFGVFEKGV